MNLVDDGKKSLFDIKHTNFKKIKITCQYASKFR